MLVLVSLFIADFINNFIIFKIFFKLNNKEYKITIKLVLIFCLLAIISAVIIKTIAPSFLLFLVKLIVGIFASTLVIKEKLPRRVMTFLLIYITLAISEGLFAAIYLGILQQDASNLSNSMFVIFLSNLIIITLFYIIINIKKVSILYKNIVDWYNERYITNTLAIIICTTAPLCFFLIKNIKGHLSAQEYIINGLVVISIMSFIVGYFKQFTDNHKLLNKYDIQMGLMKTYEFEINEKSKWQHEYKNQLLILRDKISKNNTKASKYIDGLLKNSPSDDNSQWLSKLSKFPDIGLKGLIQYKIRDMQTREIKVFVDVIGDEIDYGNSGLEFIEDNLQDISRALGVYLDNAIDAAAQSNQKYLILELQCYKKSLVFQISNTYQTGLNLEKLDQENFTTKGHGHGNGLAIVRDVLEKNKNIEQEREINGIYFVQKLIINIK